MSTRSLPIALLSAAALLAAAACSGTHHDSPDAGAAPDAKAIDAAVMPDGADTSPIAAPDDQWTWVDFPGSKCASGSATGIAVNPHAGATTLVFYFEGGGSCGDGSSCWGPDPTANYLAGYDATTFGSAAQVKYPVLDRSLAGNPLAAANMVYVPYCTGDLHGGTVEAQLSYNNTTIPTYFWGAKDIDIFLQRVVPTFTGTTRIISLGTSAGGFGTMLSYSQITSAFPGIRVDIIDDSGPAITAKGATDNAATFTNWGITPPAACTGCNSYRDVLDYDRQLQPNSQYAFLTFSQDTVISGDFGYTLAEYPAVMTTYSQSFASDPNAATYIVTNVQSHVVESDLSLSPDYMPWLSAMVSGGSAWVDTSYP
jgi:hypothetical protein